MNDFDDRLRDLGRDAHWAVDVPANAAMGAIAAVRRHDRLRVACAAAAVALVVAVSGTIAVRGGHSATGPPADAVAVPTPTPATSVATLTFAGVTVPAQPGWTVHELSQPTALRAVACIGPYTPVITVPVAKRYPDGDHVPTCVGGIMVSRTVGIRPPLAQGLPTDRWPIDTSCWAFGMQGRDPRTRPSSTPPPLMPTVQDLWQLDTHGQGLWPSWRECVPSGLVAGWDVTESHATIAAAKPFASGVAEALRAMTIAELPLAEPSDPAPVEYAVQDHGVTMTLPAWWSIYSPGATECIGLLHEHSDPGSLTCPLDGLLVRGAGFFSGKPTVSGQGGPAKPDPWSPTGYLPNEKKATHDVVHGCARLAQVVSYGAIPPPVSSPSQETPVEEQRLVVDEGKRTVGGQKAEYRAWRTTCPDGTAFLWRRWWLREKQTMIDSYDMPGGLTPEFIDDLLATKTAFTN